MGTQVKKPEAAEPLKLEPVKEQPKVEPKKEQPAVQPVEENKESEIQQDIEVLSDETPKKKKTKKVKKIKVETEAPEEQAVPETIQQDRTADTEISEPMVSMVAHTASTEEYTVEVPPDTPIVKVPDTQEELIVEEKPKDYRRGSITIEEIKPQDAPAETLKKEPEVKPQISEPVEEPSNVSAEKPKVEVTAEPVKQKPIEVTKEAKPELKPETTPAEVPRVEETPAVKKESQVVKPEVVISDESLTDVHKKSDTKQDIKTERPVENIVKDIKPETKPEIITTQKSDEVLLHKTVQESTSELLSDQLNETIVQDIKPEIIADKGIENSVKERAADIKVEKIDEQSAKK